MKYGFYKMEDFDSPVNYCLNIKKHNNKRSETLDYVYFYNISDLKQYCINHSINLINERV
jgi:hypothetical protein